MRTTNDLWDSLGELPDQEAILVITRIFSHYEEKLRSNPDDPESLKFFRQLDIALSQTEQCNLNRR